MIEVVGSVLEGGGQVLRMAMALSGLKCEPIRISDIRGGRAKKGLAAQHVCGLQLVQQLTSGDLQGCSLGSTEVTFHPAGLDANKAQDFCMDIKTAGATTLLAQVSLPLALFRGKKTVMDLKGGTDAEMAPSVDYYQYVFLKLLNQFGASFDVELVKRGYFPRGGGHLRLVVQSLPPGQPLKAISLVDPGQNVVKVVIHANSAGKVSSEAANRMALAAKKHVIKFLPRDIVSLDVHYLHKEKATGNGSSIFIEATTSTGCVLGASAIGSPKKTPEDTGLFAAGELMKAIAAKVCLDEHAQDQVIILMALAKGHSKVLTGRLTLHTKTAIYIAELLTKAKFTVTEGEVTSIIECDGIGYTAK